MNSVYSFMYLRSDTESADVKATKKNKKFTIITLDSLLKKKAEKNLQKPKPVGTEASAGAQGAENQNEDDENAARSEATVIIEDEPAKKVISVSENKKLYYFLYVCVLYPNH